MDAALLRLREIIKASARIAFLGGAGVSTESGIPDFRSESGVYRALQYYGESPETLLSIEYFTAQPEKFFTYYRDLLLYPDARPNPAHYALAELERQGKLTAVITQNIDGLHQLAGSKTVLELHGTMQRNYCMRCKQEYPLSYITQADGVPYCACGGIVRPDVVLYGEALNDECIRNALTHIRKADTLLVGGTSLCVYPAAGLIDYFSGNNLILINKSVTAMDDKATLVLHAPIGEVLHACMEH